MQELFRKWEVVIQAAILRAKMAMGRVRNSNGTLVEKDEIMKDARILSNDYIEDRLIRSGLNMKTRKVTPATLYAIREVPERKNVSMQTLEKLLDKRNDVESEESKLSVEDVSKVLICVGEYLELRHNGLYSDILQQLNVRSIVETNLNRLFMSVAHELFATSITWAKIVSLFAFAGGLAVDCVLGGSTMHVSRVKSWTTEFIETELMDWIQNEGGWVAMFDHFMIREDQESSPNQFYWTLSAIILVISVIITAATVVHFRRT